MKRVLFTLGVLLAAAAASGQVLINPLVAKVDFLSTDHSAIIPVGQPNAGQPVITSYQASVFPIAADVTTGTPLVVGPVIAKTLAVSNPTATALRLTFAQLGIATVGPTGIPACTVVAPAVCPQYSVLLVAIGPGGTSLRGIGNASDSFTLAPLQPNPQPAAPSTVKVQP